LDRLRLKKDGQPIQQILKMREEADCSGVVNAIMELVERAQKEDSKTAA
jgi:hypothetical protein